MDFTTLYIRYLEQGYSEVAAIRLAGEITDGDDWDVYDDQEGWW